MPRLSMLPALFREIFFERTLPREPEPDLVMENSEQVEAYSHAGRIDGVMAAAYLFHSARISQIIQDCKNVVDLGCGPATQLCQIAELNPAITFHGVDLSDSMLETAKIYAKSKNINNIIFYKGDITNLSFLQDKFADAVISTMALHHLPSHQLLENCFSEINRILKPNGGLYLVDFGRLKSLKSVIYFAYINAKQQPHLFTLDYERSLRAAFAPEDFQRLQKTNFAHATTLSTFLMPILTLIKTQDRPLTPALSQRINEMRRALPKKYLRDLDEIRTFFKLGGLKNDPFN